MLGPGPTDPAEPSSPAAFGPSASDTSGIAHRCSRGVPSRGCGSARRPSRSSGGGRPPSMLRWRTCAPCPPPSRGSRSWCHPDDLPAPSVGRVAERDGVECLVAQRKLPAPGAVAVRGCEDSAPAHRPAVSPVTEGDGFEPLAAPRTVFTPGGTAVRGGEDAARRVDRCAPRRRLRARIPFRLARARFQDVGQEAAVRGLSAPLGPASV